MEILPIGSVILPKKSKKGLMIIGYLPNKIEDSAIDKYLCCYCNLGITKPNKKLKLNSDIFYINDKDIDRVLFMGYQDDDFNNYKKNIEYIFNTLDELNKIKKTTHEDIIKLLLNLISDRKKASNEE